MCIVPQRASERASPSVRAGWNMAIPIDPSQPSVGHGVLEMVAARNGMHRRAPGRMERSAWPLPQPVDRVTTAGPSRRDHCAASPSVHAMRSVMMRAEPIAVADTAKAVRRCGPSDEGYSSNASIRVHRWWRRPSSGAERTNHLHKVCLTRYLEQLQRPLEYDLVSVCSSSFFRVFRLFILTISIVEL